jgi:predicted nucleic acid-binding protein
VILADLTVLAYAVGDDHPLRLPCRQLLEAHGEGRLEMTTTVETLGAFLDLRLARHAREDAVTLTRHLANALRPIVTTRTDLERALTLMDAHPALAPAQAVLAAVALGHDDATLLSADPVYAGVPGLRWVHPAGPAADALLAPQPLSA